MKNEPFKIYLLLILTMTLWGGGWIANKIIVSEANIIVLTFWRFFITFLTIAPLLFIMKKPLKMNFHVVKVSTFGALLNIAFMLLAFLGVMAGFAGRAGVVITTLSPIITFVLAGIIFQTAFKKEQFYGLFLGLLGGMVMFEIWDFNFDTLMNDGSLYLLICAFLWSVVTIAGQKSKVHLDPIYYSILLTGIGSLLLFFAALPYDISIVFEKDTRFWISLLYISALAQGLATTIYYYASVEIGSAKSSSFLFIVPLTSLFFGWLILDESAPLALLIGGAINVVALYIITRK